MENTACLLTLRCAGRKVIHTLPRWRELQGGGRGGSVLGRARWRPWGSFGLLSSRFGGPGAAVCGVVEEEGGPGCSGDGGAGRAPAGQCPAGGGLSSLRPEDFDLRAQGGQSQWLQARLPCLVAVAVMSGFRWWWVPY